MELKEKVVLSTEPQGSIKIEEDTENLRQEFDKLSNKIQVNKNQLFTTELNKILSKLLL